MGFVLIVMANAVYRWGQVILLVSAVMVLVVGALLSTPPGGNRVPTPPVLFGTVNDNVFYSDETFLPEPNPFNGVDRDNIFARGSTVHFVYAVDFPRTCTSPVP
jgi:hypothetical protein